MGTSAIRQVVVECDGTNNTLTGGIADTNVVLLHRYLRDHPPTDPNVERILSYDPGVGNPDTLPPTDLFDWAARVWNRVWGLASGRGVYENIAAGYSFLMRQWRGPEDRIYVFGFSRGAFTARAISGMVNLFGIIRPEHEILVPTLVQIYFSLPEKGGTSIQKLTRSLHDYAGRPSKAEREIAGNSRLAKVGGRNDLAEEVKDLFATKDGREAQVHWVGVWDTVESVGLPGPLSRSNPSSATLRGKHIRNARHALSLDEHRWTFEPRLYEEPGDLSGPQTLKQRWFPGVHCDVGGSYPREEAGLSDAALRWMINEVATDMGLPQALPPETKLVRHDPLWSSPWWALTGMAIRNMQPRIDIPDRASMQIDVIADMQPEAVIDTVWSKRRGLVPVVFAVLAGIVTLLLSGLCLVPPESRHLDFPTLMQALDAPGDFAYLQFQSVLSLPGAGSGLLTPGQAPWLLPGQPAWSMFWDLAFIACYGYVLARIASRAFTWLAGDNVPNTPPPWWRWLGMAPLMAVGGDVCEDLLTLAALAAHGAETDIVACGLLWLGSLGSAVKFAGLLVSLVLVIVRCHIVFHDGLEWPVLRDRTDGHAYRTVTRYRHRFADIYAALTVAALAAVIWSWARLFVCNGGHAWIGDLACKAHYVTLPMVIVAVALAFLLVSDVRKDRPVRINDRVTERGVASLVKDPGFNRRHRWHMVSTFTLTMAAVVLLALVVFATDILF